MKQTTATEAQVRLQETLARFGRPPDLLGEEAHLRWILAQLHREYQACAQPVVDRLCAIENAKPSSPIILLNNLISGK